MHQKGSGEDSVWCMRQRAAWEGLAEMFPVDRENPPHRSSSLMALTFEREKLQD